MDLRRRNDRFGTPRTPHDLDGHPASFPRRPATCSRSNPRFAPNFGTGYCRAETNAAAALLGLGLTQVPRYRVASDLAAGAFVEVLADFPPSPSPVYVLYPHSRQISPRLRVFIDWLTAEFAARLPRSRG
jgi:DNA-binding transcriptional LysR family regulator